MYTPTQEKQIEFLRRCEPNEILGSSREYHIICYTCHDHIVLKSADVSRMWLTKHSGHSTWLQLVK